MDEKELEEKKSKSLKEQKEKEKAQIKQQKKDEKRINKILISPYKALMNLALLFMIIGFFVFYFGAEFDIIESSYRAFLIFSAIYVGLGLLAVLIYYAKYKSIINEEQRREEGIDDKDDIDDKEIERIIGEDKSKSKKETKE